MTEHNINLLSLLPEELVTCIYDYIPLSALAFLKREYYIKYHKYIKYYIPIALRDNFLRDILRKDSDFVLDQIIKENGDSWLNSKRYKYKYIIYSDYFHYLYYFCCENNATNCKNLFAEFLKKRGISKNQHKKNIDTNVRWTN
jgi:hypothetical protein